MAIDGSNMRQKLLWSGTGLTLAYIKLGLESIKIQGRVELAGYEGVCPPPHVPHRTSELLRRLFYGASVS
jgi:hypothetical protein